MMSVTHGVPARELRRQFADLGGDAPAFLFPAGALGEGDEVQQLAAAHRDSG